MSIDVPLEEDYEQELAEAWDDIDDQEPDPDAVKKARALEMEWYRKMHVYEKRPIEECFEKTKKPPDRPQQRRETERECEIDASGKADQQRQGRSFVRCNTSTGGFGNASVNDGDWEQIQGANAQGHKPSVDARKNDK